MTSDFYPIRGLATLAARWSGSCPIYYGRNDIYPHVFLLNGNYAKLGVISREQIAEMVCRMIDNMQLHPINIKFSAVEMG